MARVNRARGRSPSVQKNFNIATSASRNRYELACMMLPYMGISQSDETGRKNAPPPTPLALATERRQSFYKQVEAVMQVSMTRPTPQGCSRWGSGGDLTIQMRSTPPPWGQYLIVKSPPCLVYKVSPSCCIANASAFSLVLNAINYV